MDVVMRETISFFIDLSLLFCFGRSEQSSLLIFVRPDTSSYIVSNNIKEGHHHNINPIK